MSCKQGKQAAPVKAVTLVLPNCGSWPDKAEEASICDILTNILAVFGGKASVARVAVPTGNQECQPRASEWRLACVIGRP
jgi:hypothetical protein